MCCLFLSSLFCCWCFVPLYGTDLAHLKSHRERHHAQCAKKWQKYSSNNNSKQKQRQYLISSDRKHTQEVFFRVQTNVVPRKLWLSVQCIYTDKIQDKQKHMQTRFPFTSSHLYHHCLSVFVCWCAESLRLFVFSLFVSLTLLFSFPIFLYNLISRQCYLRTYIVLFVLTSEGVVESKYKSLHKKRIKREKV